MPTQISSATSMIVFEPLCMLWQCSQSKPHAEVLVTAPTTVTLYFKSRHLQVNHLDTCSIVPALKTKTTVMCGCYLTGSSGVVHAKLLLTVYQEHLSVQVHNIELGTFLMVRICSLVMALETTPCLCYYHIGPVLDVLSNYSPAYVTII